MLPKLTLLLSVLFAEHCLIEAAKVRHHHPKQALKFLSHGIGSGINLNKRTTLDNIGLWPSVFNLATKALISVNATCGEGGREDFCKFAEGSRGRCGVCDNFSPDSGKRHPIHYAIDGSNRWWQSPALYNGPEFEYVTIILDLKQVYQVAYVIIKAANAPRPGAWILEKSLDGENYSPWQYFARNDKECLERYGVPANKGKPHYVTDFDVICTSHYSKLTPLENGEIHTSLIHGRPGANETSPELLEFTKARYVRVRLQGFRANVEPLPRWFSQDLSRDKRLFYSIRDISVGGQCVCNGHAASCRHNVASGHPECECAHHTCGPNCDHCCPMYNQRQWGPGSSRDARKCLPCFCYGHATSCHYDANVDRDGRSLDKDKEYQGGGVCDNCTAHTAGINCEKCIEGYYRPPGLDPGAEEPCLKCDCLSPGSTGNCIQEGEMAGSCLCKEGYAGLKCQQCSPGYRGYPNCELCPCDTKGVISSGDCEGDCLCKVNVEGKLCDRCKSGHFSLSYDHPEGCIPCYCSAVTTLCESAILQSRKIHEIEEWLVSDILVKNIVTPMWEADINLWSIVNYEIPAIEAYFWLAPKAYTGNRLDMYGTTFSFSVRWVVMRGDTSGKPTTGPNIILIGANGMRIAYGDDYLIGNNKTFQILMAETDWYHVPAEVKDIVTRQRRTEYKGDLVTRGQFLDVLMNVKHVLLRAKFHMDQIEGGLETATWHSQADEREGYGAVEKCSCPSGYTGLSCESCDYGYVRLVTNTSAHQEQGFCVKCDCNGHSNTCNPDTGECWCEHNTTGEKCDRCIAGYYGNPLIGTAGDCKRCACPLIADENNFSPSCQLDFVDRLDSEEETYVCTQCPKGYTGDHCEICDDGFFGDPLEPKNKCEPCSCGGGPCHRKTGQCLGCPGNTDGWRCEKCKPQHFGDPLNADCQACLCDPVGSLSADCDNVTGQCACKERFIGRNCEQCDVGYGNVTAKCTPCSCNQVGSVSDVCDPITGICACKKGVEGFHCDVCQHLHYGFSEEGCGGCNCNARGSELPTCDITTGQCRCRPFYIGRTCDNCQNGFWETANGCIECQCDADGSRGQICNQRTGQCDCKPGVGGIRCDTCLPGHFGFCDTGCRACDPCSKKGHICDPDTGRCVCPPYSHGEYCHICSLNSWGYEPNKGCKQCNCSQSGSTKMQCNSTTGECTCKLGYDGSNCNRCAHGYFGYPRCRRCNCNLAGTDRYKAQCDNNAVCQCNEDGQCPCKINVSGTRCDQCTDGTFSLQLENPDGCTQCFCFGRSTKCTEAGLTWGQIRLNASRILSINTHPISKHEQVDDVEHSGKLLVIPRIYGNVTVDRQPFASPLYWRLHPIFEGDRVLSYGGYLRFTTDTLNPVQRLPQNVLNHYPLVQLRSHGRIVLEYYPPLPNPRNLHEVRLHESLWKRIFPKDTHLSPRELLMIALQNFEGIYIKASDFVEFESLTLQDVILDTAIEVPGNPPPLAKGVEICECPQQYNLTSCQSPSIGFFRYYTPNSVNGTILIDTLVGQARPCECNGRSDICDVETGHCLHCRNYTAGRYCDKCEEGYYGNPMEAAGHCEPCPCPSTTQHFARDCRRMTKPSIHFVCKCKPGYSGPKCDECSSGYFGQPKLPGGSCKPCNCNVQGRASDECDAETGQCNCKPGVVGLQCTQCVQPRYVLQQYICAPCDNCTQWLLDDLDWMTNELRMNTIFLEGTVLNPPWEVLKRKETAYEHYNNKLTSYRNNLNKLTHFSKNSTLNEMQKRIGRMQDSLSTMESKYVYGKGTAIAANSNALLSEINGNNEKLEALLNTLDNFGKSHINTKDALERAKGIMWQIKNIDQQIEHPSGAVLQKCIQVLGITGTVLNTSSTNTKHVKMEMEGVENRIADLKELLMDIQLVNSDVDTKNKISELQLIKLNGTVNLIISTKTSMLDDLKQTEQLLNDTSKSIDNLRSIHKLMDDLHLNNLTRELAKRVANLSTIEYDNILYKTLQHVLVLEKNASRYVMAFNLSSRDIDIIKASEAYKNIFKFINDAKESAREANEQLHNALNTLLPAKKDPLAVNASISNFDSERLEIRIKNLQDKLEGIRQKQNNLTIQVNTVDSNIWRNGLKNRAQDSKLLNERNKVNKQSKENMEGVIKDIFKETNRIKDIHRKIMDLNTTKEYELKRPFYRLLNLTTSERLNEIEKKIGSIPTQLKKVFSTNFTFVDVAKEHGLSHDHFQNVSSSIAARLNALKAQIQKARQSVEGMRMSLSGLSCSRSYLMRDMHPSLSTSLEVTFNYTPTFQANNSLFYVATDDNQFLHLFVSNSKLGFKWRLGKKENTIDTDVQLQNDFYTVLIERILNHVSIKIRYKGRYIFEKVIEQKAAEDGNVMFNFNPGNLIHIGSSPDTPNGISGCIKDVILNKQKLGLWNYITSSGNCSSCVRPSEVSENAFDFFNGQSYFNVSRELQKDSQSPTRFYVHFVLRTFDENALLFLAPEEQQKRGYLSVSLEDGRIKYQVYYNKNQKPLTLLTEKRYNNGERWYVSVKKFYDKSTKKDIARLHVANETLEDETTVNPSSILKLGTVNFYFGGIPSDFNMELHGIARQPLLGGLEEIAGHQTFNLDNNDKNIRMYGIEKRNGELEFKEALFKGKGFLLLKTVPINNKLLFLIRTTNTHSFIMQINQDFRIVIEEGQLHVLSLEDSYALHSGQIINDDKYYLIEVEMKNNITLKINGKLLDSKHYKDRQRSIESNIVFGGSMDVNMAKFSGLISNIIIDNQIVYFNKTTVRDFEQVQIGHTIEEKFEMPKNLEKFNNVDDSLNTTNPFNIKDMQNTESCENRFTYSLDPDAAKFGDKPNSYVLHFLKDLFWRKDYTVELKFRTLRSRGLLFIALGPREHFTSLEVANGKVLLKVYGKKKKELTLPQKVDDGRWHTVVATKRKRKVLLQIDDKSKSVKIPKNNVMRELYIGGVAANTSLPDEMKDFQPFYGCIKGLVVNKIVQSLVKDKHYNIGQCFPTIEEGAFFGGDSYSIYKKYFQIENALELSFDFRTTEQNGILLSVSNPENKPALSLELQNGAVVLTANNGYITSSVTNNLSDFVLCNNNWHNVTAVYSTSEITVTVDGIRKSWVQPDSEHLMSELEAPLYIGGISDSVPVGTLKMKENFKGCMKNVRINNKLAEWSAMEKLHNVRLDSCPVVT